MSNHFDRVVTVLEISEKSGKMKRGCNGQGKLGKFEKERGKSGKSQKLLPLLRFNSMISVSAKMLYQEVMQNLLRSGRSQGKVRENASRKKWPPCWISSWGFISQRTANIFHIVWRPRALGYPPTWLRLHRPIKIFESLNSCNFNILRCTKFNV